MQNERHNSDFHGTLESSEILQDIDDIFSVYTIKAFITDAYDCNLFLFPIQPNIHVVSYFHKSFNFSSYANLGECWMH